MLGKLLKYEFKSTARIFLPLYPALLIVALLNKIMYTVFESSTFITGIPKALLSTIYFVVLVGIMVITFLMMIQRFYKNLMGDEGYLMFTLPVKSNVLIFSKLIVSVVWSIASSFIAIISVLILVPNYNFLSEIPRAMGLLNRELIFTYGVGIWPIAIALIFLALVSLIFSILMIYVSISLGHLIGRHKVAASFAAYLVISTITQAVLMIGFAIYSFIERNNLHSIDLYDKYNNIPMVILIFIIAFIAFFAIFSGVYFYITQKILEKKLNLDG